MLDCLKEFNKIVYDIISFIEGEDGKVSITGLLYENPGETDTKTDIGEKYHIVLYRDSRTDPEKYDDFEKFEAILGDPLEYISTLIPSGWYGVVARKTSTSGKYINELLDNIQKMDYTVTVFN